MCLRCPLRAWNLDTSFRLVLVSDLYRLQKFTFDLDDVGARVYGVETRVYGSLVILVLAHGPNPSFFLFGGILLNKGLDLSVKCVTRSILIKGV